MSYPSPRFYDQDWSEEEKSWFSRLASLTGFDIRARRFDFSSGVAFSYQPPKEQTRQGIRWHKDGVRYLWSGWPSVEVVAEAVDWAWNNKPRKPFAELLQDREFDLGFLISEMRQGAS